MTASARLVPAHPFSFRIEVPLLLPGLAARAGDCLVCNLGGEPRWVQVRPLNDAIVSEVLREFASGRIVTRDIDDLDAMNRLVSMVGGRPTGRGARRKK